MRNVTARALDVLDDARDQGDVRRAAGAVDILFNCAGWVHQGTILECTPADWDLSFNLNVRAMFVTIQAMLPKMLAAGGGVILNMASVLGSIKGMPNRLAYGASKAAVIGLTQALAIDHVKQGIRVQLRSARAPSTRPRSATASTPSPIPCRRARTSSRASRWGGSPPPKKSRESFVFLVSDESSFVTGNVYSSTAA